MKPALTRRSALALAAPMLILATAAARAQGPGAPPARKPHVGIIGAGTVGGTLGKLLVQAGYAVTFSSRHPEGLRAMAESLGPLASVGLPADAASRSDVVLMAVPYGALPEVGRQLQDQLRGKIVIDATNPYVWRDGDVARRAEQVGVGAEAAVLMPGAKVVRAFNSMSTLTIAERADRASPHLAIPYTGDDWGAVSVATDLIGDMGLVPVLVGGLDSARLFQPGGPGWQVIGTASELRRRLALPDK